MPAVADRQSDPKYIFKQCWRWRDPMPYPQNAQFQARVTQAEWAVLRTEFYKVFMLYACLYGGLVGLTVFLASSHDTVKTITVPLVAVVFLTVKMSFESTNLFHDFNYCLFMHRGCKVFYGGNYMFGRFAYPATFQAADRLHGVIHNEKCFDCKWGNRLVRGISPQNYASSNLCAWRINILDNRFRAANAAFANSALARTADPASLSNIGHAQMYPLANVSMMDFRSVPLVAPVANCVTVQVPLGASPGSVVQVIYNGIHKNVTIPPGVHPGQLVIVNTSGHLPPTHPASQLHTTVYANVV